MKTQIAYHEAGHVVAGHALEIPISSVTTFRQITHRAR